MYRPELVDLKITNKCYAGCKYCYQSSHSDGKFAFEYTIRDILDVLHELECFEVVIGGGEPLTHPALFKIAKMTKRRNILPSVSTRVSEVFRYSPVRNLFNIFSGIGLSVDGPEQVPEWIRESNISLIHYVVGARSCWQADILGFMEKLQGWGMPGLLLLHPKRVGRGEDFDFYDINYEVLAAQMLPKAKIRVSIDTMLAEKMAPYMDVDERLYRTDEGVHSKYIDAVEKVVGPSSYSEKGRMFSFARTNGFGVDKDELRDLLVREL